MLKHFPAADLNEHLREQLTAFIINSDLQPGDRLPSEPQLVKTFGVSRNAVREALRGLEALGVIEAKHGKGRFLRPFDFGLLADNLALSLVFDKTSIRELLEVRCALELEFLPKAIDALEKKDVERLRHIVEVMQAKTRGGETQMTEEVQFHRTLFHRVENSLLQKLFLIFWALLQNVSDNGVVPPPQSPDIVDYHARIVDAIEAGDAGEAQRVLREHFGDLVQRVNTIELDRDRPADLDSRWASADLVDV